MTDDPSPAGEREARESTVPPWLAHVRRLHAIAQTGLAYASDPYDLERYRALAATTASLVAEIAGVAPRTVRDVLGREEGYATPKVDVRAAAFQRGEILLVRERSDGCWTLPGGWADIGESPSEVVAKEVREESGYEVRVTKLAAVLDRDRHGHPVIPHHVYKLFFLCEITGGAPGTSVETSAVGFFPEHALPPLSLTRIVPGEIARMFEHHRHADLPTDFD